jgi:pantetheine-phosphate adenylyltransferase
VPVVQPDVMSRICLFPGTFDPVTLGHVDIINRALPLFDRIIVGIGLNIRYVSDFEYEKTIADANRTLDKSIEKIFLTGDTKYTSVASTIVRDIIRNNGDASHFLPEIVFKSLPAR